MCDPLWKPLLFLRLVFFSFLLVCWAAAHTLPVCVQADERELRPALMKHWFMGEPRRLSERSMPIRSI